MQEPIFRVRRRIGRDEFEAEGRESVVLQQYREWREELRTSPVPEGPTTDPNVAIPESPAPAEASMPATAAPAAPTSIAPRRPKYDTSVLPGSERFQKEMLDMIAAQERRDAEASRMAAEMAQLARREEGLIARLGLNANGLDMASMVSRQMSEALAAHNASIEKFYRDALDPYQQMGDLLGHSLLGAAAARVTARSAVTPTSAAPIGNAMLTAAFDTGVADGVRLRRPGPTPAASVLLALYGFRALAAQESVTGATLQAALTASGVNIPRLDREVESVGDKIKADGERRSRRYSLTSAGTAYVEDLLRSWDVATPKGTVAER